MAVSDTVRFTLERLVEHQRAHEAAILEEHETAELRIVAEGTGLTDDSIVFFEGHRVRWADLMLQDRKAYFNDGYPY